MSGDFTEQRFDYTGGRPDASMLTIMVGVSGSGKSVMAKHWVNWGRGNVVRLNRDTLRAMLYMDVPWSSKLENLTRGVEKEAVRMALQMGKEVIVDDTNCNRNVRYDWEKMAQQMRCRFRIVTMTIDLKVCIERDSKREGKERVGEGVIRKQWKDLNEVKVTVKKEAEPAKMTRPYFNRLQLQQGGFLPRLPGCPWVLVDVDGTVEDNPYPTIITEVNRLNGLKVKVKFAEYVRLHRILTGLNPKAIWELLSEKSEDTVYLWLNDEKMPDEFKKWLSGWVNQLKAKYEDIHERAKITFHLRPREEELGRGPLLRKAQAMYFLKSPDLAHVCFAMLDGKEYSGTIWRQLKPKATDTFKADDGS